MIELLESPILARSLNVLIAIIAIVSAGAKIGNLPAMRTKWNDQLQMPDSLRVAAGLIELSGAFLFLIPTTITIGSVILTAYLGGAIALHLRIGKPRVSIYGSIMIVLIWMVTRGISG